MDNLLVAVLLIAGCLLLIGAGLHDFGFRTVPNWVSAALLLIGVALRIMQAGLGIGLVFSLLAAGAVLLVTFLFWRFGWMGGGDVKLLTAAAVFVPPVLVPMLLLATALSGGLLALLYLLAGKIVPKPALRRPRGVLRRAWRCELWRLRRRGPLPYAAAIAAGGVFAALAA